MFGDPLEKQFSQSLLDAARKINDKTTADAKTAKEEKERLEADPLEDMIGQFDESSKYRGYAYRLGLGPKILNKNPRIRNQVKSVPSKALDDAEQAAADLGTRQKASRTKETQDESVTLAALGTIAGSVVAGAAVGTTLDALRKKLFRKKDPAVEYAKNVAKGKAEAEKTRLRSNRILAMRTGPRNSNR